MSVSVVDLGLLCSQPARPRGLEASRPRPPCNIYTSKVTAPPQLSYSPQYFVASLVNQTVRPGEQSGRLIMTFVTILVAGFSEPCRCARVQRGYYRTIRRVNSLVHKITAIIMCAGAMYVENKR